MSGELVVLFNGARKRKISREHQFEEFRYNLSNLKIHEKKFFTNSTFLISIYIDIKDFLNWVAQIYQSFWQKKFENFESLKKVVNLRDTGGISYKFLTKYMKKKSML